MKILIGADLVSTKSNREAFAAGDTLTLLGDKLQAYLAQSDFRVMNLEAPLTDTLSPIAKCGPCMAMPTADAAGLKAMGTDLVTLANNHSLDHGQQGLESTLRTLEKLKIFQVGAGKNVREAAKPFILERDGLCVGIYACSEHEFATAGEETGGANPFDPLWSLDHVRELKEKCDYVVVLYHGGREEYQYPSPDLQRVCRRLADKGADLVLCQHSHCIGCREQWGESTIVYGQGNFLFNIHRSELHETGLLVELEFAGGKPQIRFIPIEQIRPFIRLAEGERAEMILEGFEARSRKLQEPGFTEREYRRYARETIPEYYRRSMGRSCWLLFRLVNIVFCGRLLHRCYSREDVLALQNLLECETHRELYAVGLKEVREARKR